MITKKQQQFLAKPLHRGDIVLADLRHARGSEQGGVRPAVVIQNNDGNRRSNTTIVIPITRQDKCRNIPTHVPLGNVPFLDVRSIAIAEQITTVDKDYIYGIMGSLDDALMYKIEHAVRVSIGRKEAFV